ncbi:MAG: DNA-binding response OmpR family regulator [Saprospiraceae bacterium]
MTTSLEDYYHIISAQNGKIGLEKALKILPDIIISDVMMPEMDGFEVCEKLKKDERTNHIPIILLTAKATSEDKMAGLSYGADAYLIKPF